MSIDFTSLYNFSFTILEWSSTIMNFMFSELDLGAFGTYEPYQLIFGGAFVVFMVAVIVKKVVPFL